MPKAEAEALAGKSFSDGRATSVDTPVGQAGGCVYILANPAGGVPTTVNIVLTGTKVTRELLESELMSDASDATDVAGVGEVAKLLQPGILTVLDHGAAFTVEIFVDGVGAPTDVLVKVAKEVIDRL